jgi:hypothetical protein
MKWIDTHFLIGLSLLVSLLVSILVIEFGQRADSSEEG